MSRFRFYLLRSFRELLRDRHGNSATEFALIVPIMLVGFFGTVEFSSGVATDRKITIFARTVSDLTSQAPKGGNNYATVNDTYLQNVFTAGMKILNPYLQGGPQAASATVSQIYVDSNGIATIVWSRAATLSPSATQATLTASSRHAGDVVTSIVPAQLLQRQTYLIFSETSYLYVPTIGYVMAPTGVTLADTAYSAPRLGACVVDTDLNLPVLVSGACPLT